MVKYEIHLFESTTYGSTIAFVGQASMQAVQLPQKSSCGKSLSSFVEVKIVARKIHEPKSFEIKLLCFPLQPIPDFCAKYFSKIGPVST